MFTFLAISPSAASALVFVGLIILFIGGIWTLVVAAQRSVLWFLAVFFLSPIANLILLFVEPRAIKPFVLGLVGCGVFVFGVLNTEGDKPFGQKLEAIFHDEEEGESDEKGKVSLEAPSAQPLEARKKRIQDWQKQLEAKKAAIRPGDTVAQAAFDKELKEYMADLNILKADIAAGKK